METIQGDAIDNNIHIINEKYIMFHREEIGGTTLGQVYKEFLFHYCKPSLLKWFSKINPSKTITCARWFILKLFNELRSSHVKHIIISSHRKSNTFPLFIVKLLSF